ncbi:class I SAM-dependent methyltransferase [Micromonospora siamensis]|uniref:Methyltransferase domain-containing protein n=1 Tax=Micromonospora siamensis TaxID=299152 RepID=A0A1C5HSD4_9ACTN|nr:class I SAM-dependent methyltransferase [Micromonospora siamensis]SCG48827.1 Methyltransferase domain-containing protein [Micromonospora siamensis]
MPYRLVETDPPADAVRRLTLVPFLPDGSCAAVPDGHGELRLPAGAVRDGEHWLLDAALRIPLETAGFRPQRVHPFAADGDHLYAWLDGDRYSGRRPHATVELVTGPAAALATRLATAGRPEQARAVRDGARSLRGQDDASWYADAVRLLEPAYLRGETPQAGSGFGGDAAQWRALREMVVDGVYGDGSFLDLGCANGLLLESVVEWAAERGHRLDPYGVDLAPGLVALARRRLPHWADRFEVGNAIGWRPADGRRFGYVHLLLDLVPPTRRAQLVRHARELVAPGGRLLVSHYQATGGTDLTAAEHLRWLGFRVHGSSAGADPQCATTAWLDV